MKKVRVYHFHNGSGGGVLSVIRNLLRFSSGELVENHVIHVINKDVHKDGYQVPGLAGAASETVFYYAATWNFYHTCRGLAALLPDDQAVIVAHDWLELGMASCLGLQNPVVQFVHGDYSYYYELAQRHRGCVDIYIAVSATIAAKLREQMPGRADVILYRRFPVPAVKAGSHAKEGLRIIYIVRDVTEGDKNFQLLPLVNDLLLRKGVTVHWTIVGRGLTAETFSQAWGDSANYTYHPGLPNQQLLEIIPAHHLFILPSHKEGFPVTVVEAMKAGCIPLITDWGGATAELVVEGETGYYFRPDDVEGYAGRIATLYSDRQLLDRLTVNALEKANQLFDPHRNTLEIERMILRCCVGGQKKYPAKVYGSRLDQPWMPNVITHFIRSLNRQK